MKRFKANFFALFLTSITILTSLHAAQTEENKNALLKEQKEIAVQAEQKIEDAEEEQSFAARMYTKAKQMVTAPVDYVFGEENSYAKMAFYAIAGVALLAAGAYVYKSYGGENKDEDDRAYYPPIVKVTDVSSSVLEKLKKYGNTLELQEKGIHNELDVVNNKIKQLADQNEYLTREYERIHKNPWIADWNKDVSLKQMKGQYHVNLEEQYRLKSWIPWLRGLLFDLERVKKDPDHYGY